MKGWRRGLAAWLAVALFFLGICGGIPLAVMNARAEEVILRNIYGRNLLDGVSFDFYGSSSRNGMWAYRVGKMPVFCVEPHKRMYDGSRGTLAWYDLGDGETLPSGIPAEQAELLAYALMAGGAYEGYDQEISQGGYAMIQSAVWAILSGEWTTMEDFVGEMEKIKDHAVDRSMNADIARFLSEYYDQASQMAGDGSIPYFTSKYEAQAPSHTMTDNGDGSFTASFETNGEWWQKELVYDMPEGWDYKYEGNRVTFLCRTGNPASGVIRGHFPPGSEADRYWYRPSALSFIYPEGEDQTAKQLMVGSAGEKLPWAVFLQFGEGRAAVSMEYRRFEHREKFFRNYQIELTKYCDETGKTLEGAGFEVLEQFDEGQLVGTNLDREQILDPDQEGDFLTEQVCGQTVFTDENGRLCHRDVKRYRYHKTYCGGHPLPQPEEMEAGGDASDEERAAVQEANANAYEEAMEKWRECVEWCGENTDFHSEVEGEAKALMEADRDMAYDTFIHLVRSYTLREVIAREGYIRHEVHPEDIPVETVEFYSSQAEGSGTVVEREVSLFPRRTYWATASASNAGQSREDEEETGSVRRSSDSNADSTWPVGKRRHILSKEEYEIREPGGTLEPSQVTPINQDFFGKDKLGYSFTVRDHRTEGELHINKRDLDLYQADARGSYGQSQGDATLEGAVYGLYAADDIYHPDGKTGKVFSKGELVAIAATDANGDASFLCITEITETSRAVKNLYKTNLDKNQGYWVGRPLLLGSYYVEEISRSEGYELSRYGIRLSESNRGSSGKGYLEAGSVRTIPLSHPINQWDGSWNDFGVDYYRTGLGFSLTLSGYPKNSKLYVVEREEKETTQQVISGYQNVQKLDESHRPLYRRAEGGEYRLDADGNRISVLDLSRPERETMRVTTRLDLYPRELLRASDSDAVMEDGPWERDYVIEQASISLYEAGYKRNLDGYPWQVIPLDGHTNGQLIDSLLDWCGGQTIWDSYEVANVFEKDGDVFAAVRYGYTGIADYAALYDPVSKTVAVRKECDSPGYCYAVYPAGEYTRQGAYVWLDRREWKYEARPHESVEPQPVYGMKYDTYEPGEFLLDLDGERIPEWETVAITREERVKEVTEKLSPVRDVVYDDETGRYQITVDTSGVDWERGMRTLTFRAVAPERFVSVGDQRIPYGDYVRRWGMASVSGQIVKEETDQGSYIRDAQLFYPGQDQVYQDCYLGNDTGSRIAPLLVQQRIVRQAVMVEKTIAESSYDGVNTYKIHRDPFTVLLGGYRDGPVAKTWKGFAFRCYLKSDLEATGYLETGADGKPDYQAFFDTHEDLAREMAVAWDKPERDVDGDLSTLHANIKGGNDNSTLYYHGESAMLPYGTYVVREIQPDQFPNKSYRISAPKEVVVPTVPVIEPDGTVHEDTMDTEYFYDAQMELPNMASRYWIRFGEENHVIWAHNQDGDFVVYKYGIRREQKPEPYPNKKVGEYYKFGLSERRGVSPSVYYPVYVDRDGRIGGYGITKERVPDMTGVTTAVDRVYAPALVPWSVLNPVHGGVIDGEGTVGNRDPGLEDGAFNFVSFVKVGMENTFYSSKIRIEKLDGQTGENILHAGAYFKIYAAKRDVSGQGSLGVFGSGKVMFHPDGTPVYDESELVWMRNERGEKAGVFKACETGGVGYLETFQPLGAGAYVLVEVEAPPGYVKSPPIAFEVYSDKVAYYEGGSPSKRTEARRYQYVRPLPQDKPGQVRELYQIPVKNQPTRIWFDKVEKGNAVIRVPKATMTLYQALKIKKVGEHQYEGILIEKNSFGIVTDIRVTDSGTTGAVRQTGTSAGEVVWDYTQEKKAPVSLWRFDLRDNRVKYDAVSGNYYGLNERGVPICLVEEETGMAYVYDQTGEILVWPLDGGKKIVARTVRELENQDGSPYLYENLKPVFDELGLPVSYEDGHVIWQENQWVTEEKESHEISRLPFGSYILEETVVPHKLGYVQAQAMGITVEEGVGEQEFKMENDYTKTQIWKRDVSTGDFVPGAELVLYEAKRVYDSSPKGYHLEALRNSDGSPRVFARWTTGEEPHKLDRIPVGDYILEETSPPYELGYVKAAQVEVTVLETGEMQIVEMKEDYTSVEFLKLNGVTGQVFPTSLPAELSLYQAVYREDGSWTYDEGGLVFRWQTEDGAKVRATGKEVADASGHLYMEYQYDKRPVPGMQKTVSYTTETGALRMDYLPVGDYVLVESRAPAGFAKADPILVKVEEEGHLSRVHRVTMWDEPIKLAVSKVQITGQKEVTGAAMALYRVLPGSGERELVETWISGMDGYYTKEEALAGQIPEGYQTGDLKPHMFRGIPSGTYILTEYLAPFGMVRGTDILFEISDSKVLQRVEMKNEIVRGRLVLYKHDSKEETKGLGGAVFQVVNQTTKESFLLETGPEGRAVLEDMPIGGMDSQGAVSTYTFTVEEIKAPEGYSVNEKIHQFQFTYINDTVPHVTYTYDASNEPNQVIVEKREAGTGKLLPGAKLAVVNRETGEVYCSFISTGQPYQISHIPEGRYGLVELQSPGTGYELADPIEFTVTGSQKKALELVLYDEGTKVIVQKKASDTGGPLAGAWLEIRDEQGNLHASFRTGGQGDEIYGLALGNYILSEREAPPGYQLAESVPFTVTRGMGVKVLTMTDLRIPVSPGESPQTPKVPPTTPPLNPVIGSITAVYINQPVPLGNWVSGNPADMPKTGDVEEKVFLWMVFAGTVLTSLSLLGKRKAKGSSGRLWLIFALLMSISAGLTLDVKAAEQITVESEVGLSPDSLEKPPDIYVDKDGREYRLASLETKEEWVTGRRQPVSTVMAYEGLEQGSTVPEEVSVVVRDEESGRDVRVMIPLEESVIAGERWLRDFQFPVTFHSYDADCYRLGEKIVPFNQETPQLFGCEAELLGLVGLPSDFYRIENFQWDGAPYINEDGEKCRTALASGSRRVMDYRATYRGIAELPDLQGYRYVALYEVEEEETRQVNQRPQELRGETVSPMETEEPKGLMGDSQLWDKLLQAAYFTVGFGVLLLLAAGGRLAYGKWKKMRKDEGT